jgi:hypothetical protein
MAEMKDNSEKKPDNLEHLDKSAMLPPGMDDLKPTIQRFGSSDGAASLAKATEEQQEEAANASPGELLKSSQWRRDKLPPEEKSGMKIEGLRESDQILAPFEGNIFFEYNNVNKLPDGSLNKGKIVLESEAGIKMTMEAENMRLLTGDVPTTTSEDGIVKSSKGVPVKRGDPLFSIEKQPFEFKVNASKGAPAPGNSSPAA